MWSKNDEGAYWGQYVGEVKEGKPKGNGERSYFKGSGINEGEWKDSERHAGHFVTKLVSFASKHSVVD